MAAVQAFSADAAPGAKMRLARVAACGVNLSFTISFCRAAERGTISIGVVAMSIIRLLTDFEGRIGRAQFWLGSLIVALALLAVERLAPALTNRVTAGQIIAFSGAFALFPWAAIAAKRASDRGSVPLFGILVVCAIVLPTQLKPFLSVAWGPSLDAVALIAWVVALIDLGLLPAPAAGTEVAPPSTDAKAASWTRPHPSPSTRSIPSR